MAEDSLQWVVSAFSLSSVRLLSFRPIVYLKILIAFIQGCLFIPLGRLADVHGRKRAFLLGAIWTGAFSLGCGFSQNIISLDVLRGLQGIGPAAMVPASVCLRNTYIRECTLTKF